MVSHWDAVHTQLLALTCDAKQVYGIAEITLWDSSLLVWSQNADNTYEVPKQSNFSVQGWLCRRGSFHQLIKLLVKHRPSAIYFYSVSKAMGQQKGMSVNSVSTHGFPARKERQLSRANSRFSVVLIKSRIGGRAEASVSGIEGIKSCQRSAK